MHILKIPGKYRTTSAVQARYVEGWQTALAGQPHAYSTEKAADAFKRTNGPAQLKAYSAGYDAGVGDRPDYSNQPDKPPAK
jgi:hypothetical protein